MPTYRKASVVPVEFEAVWAFHDGLEGLRRLTPGWMGIRISQGRPDGLEATARPTAGTTFHLEIQPLNLWVGPAIEWVSEITEREVGGDRAHFADELRRGGCPFETWRHVHQFGDLGDETLIHDRVTYRLAGAGDHALAHPLLAGMFAYRHRRTRRLLSDSANP